MREVGLFVIAMAAWFALVRWVLPSLGIPTCCAGGTCQVGDAGEVEHEAVDKENER